MAASSPEQAGSNSVRGVFIERRVIGWLPERHFVRDEWGREAVSRRTPDCTRLVGAAGTASRD